MISKAWRGRATYAAMSLFVAWHSLAMLVGPAPDTSEGLSGLRALLHPYLMLFAMDNQWDFFAPSINAGYKLDYEIESQDGTTHTFVPENDLNWYRPSFIWFTEWRDAIVDNPELHALAAATPFCREHAALRPAAVTLVKIEQKEFWPQDYLDGKRPFDPDFVTERMLKRVPCPAP